MFLKPLYWKSRLRLLISTKALLLLLSAVYSVTQAATFTVSNTNDSGGGSLREAILNTNASPTLDTIAFGISGPGPHTIRPTSALPTITAPVTIDGYTQLGSSPNTIIFGRGTNAVLKIELDGSLAGPNVFGLHIKAGRSSVCGLVINRFQRSAVGLDSGGDNTIRGNFMGTDVTGSVRLGNASGVTTFNHSSNNIIGGTTAGASNLISGNLYGDGVSLRGTGNVVQGNYIGTDASGTVDLGNGAYGVRLDNSNTNNILDNVVAYNGTGGIVLFFASDNNIIARNEVRLNGNQDGITVSGPASGNLIISNHVTSNDRFGIFLFRAMDHQLIDNVIASNGQAGIWLSRTTQSLARGNSIVNNGGSGLHLDSSVLTLENNIIAFNHGANPISCSRNGNPTLTCCDVYGNEGGDWVGCIADQAGINSNFSSDPLFCDVAVGNFQLDALSPCLPQNNSCGVLIGALGLGCDAGHVCADANGDSLVNFDDVDFLMNFYFYGGATPFPYLASDLNCDGSVNIADITYLAAYINGTGAAPCCQ